MGFTCTYTVELQLANGHIAMHVRYGALKRHNSWCLPADLHGTLPFPHRMSGHRNVSSIVRNTDIIATKGKVTLV